MARHQGFFLGCMKIKGRGHAAACDFQNIAITFADDECDLCTAPLDNGIETDCCAMHNRVDLVCAKISFTEQ